ncbi:MULTISPECIES: J domain-containing protein [unclassified Rhodanobacter]|uniref:J domain-containing protein n=1 Tax=Rhodanobacter humi TaxID=1888173 RepID=A0ABV4AQ82_9GAMM
MSIKTHYDNLQVKQNAGDEVIRGAYKYLSQKWHPDKNPNNRMEAERVLKIINQAYAVLSDPVKRKEHDEWIQQQLGTTSGSMQGPPPPPPRSPPPLYPQGRSKAPRQPSPSAKAMRWQTIALRLVVGLGLSLIITAIARFAATASVNNTLGETSTISSVPVEHMPIQHIGQLEIKYTSPFLPNEPKSRRLMSALPENMRNQVRSLSVYSSQPTCGLSEVGLLVGMYAPEVQVNIDGAAAGSTKQISTLEGITNPESSIFSTTVSGYPARRVSYKADRWDGVIDGEILVVADSQSNTIWQLQLIFASKKTSNPTNLNNIRSCANEVLASVSITK